MEKIKRELGYFIVAIQFLTTIPLPVRVNLDKDEFYRISSYFPLVGLILGVLSYFTYTIMDKFTGNREIVAIVTTIVYFLLTGALHLDGLSDTVDAIFSHKDRERILSIMKDPHIGTFGVMAIVFDIAIRITYLKNPNELTILIMAPVVSRLGAVIATYLSKPAKKGEGLGSLFLGKITKRELMIALATSILTLCLLTSILNLLWLLFLTIIEIFLITAYIGYRVGGMTGDTIGFVVEILELMVISHGLR